MYVLSITYHLCTDLHFNWSFCWACICWVLHIISVQFCSLIDQCCWKRLCLTTHMYPIMDLFTFSLWSSCSFCIVACIWGIQKCNFSGENCLVLLHIYVCFLVSEYLFCCPGCLLLACIICASALIICVNVFIVLFVLMPSLFMPLPQLFVSLTTSLLYQRLHLL